MSDDLVKLRKWLDEDGCHWGEHERGIAAAFETIEQQAAEIERLREALKDLLEDTQHKDHDCGDEEWCPVIKARKVLEGKQ